MRENNMKFGIKQGSSKEITIGDILKALIKKNQNNPDMDKIRMFCEVCREIANTKEMDCSIHLESALSFEEGGIELMSAFFKKW